VDGFQPGDARLLIAEPFMLIVDPDKFEESRKVESPEYRKLCDLLYYASRNTDRYPRLKAFLWTISSRGMLPRYYGSAGNPELEEQVKLINSFLKLAYWRG
jgi:hypothetical protein